MVVFLFFCLFEPSRGYIDGSIQQDLSELKQTVYQISQILQDLDKDVKKIKLDVDKLLSNQKDTDAIKSGEMPSLTTADMFYYHQFSSGMQGIGYYSELEAIRDGRIKKNLIPMLIKIITKQGKASQNTARLYETLNNVAVAILKERESAEIEAWTEALAKYPINDALKEIEFLRNKSFKNYSVKGYEKLLESSTGNDRTKVVDAILTIKEPEDIYIELRKKISSESLTKSLNSTEPLNSLKLKAVKLRNYLENSPKDPKIVDLAYGLGVEFDTELLDYDYLQETVKMLPKPLIAFIKLENLCLVNEGQYMYGKYESEYVLVSKKNSKKPEGTEWSIRRHGDGYAITHIAMNFNHIANPGDGNRLQIKSMFGDIITWKLTFIDSSPRVKIGNGERYFKIQNNYIVLDRTPTIWDLVLC